MPDPNESVSPPACKGKTIVEVVEAFQRNWPHLKPPIFRAADVLPLLQGNDREFAAASLLIDGGRVHYPDRAPE
ncbi:MULTISPECIES: hypothetical protein [unclassified Nocardia]|uniref:hypothetical protein n=1 Tax=unclassified Nocardia TaxID=2637762 RepID=UPI0034155122